MGGATDVKTFGRVYLHANEKESNLANRTKKYLHNICVPDVKLYIKLQILVQFLN